MQTSLVRRGQEEIKRYRREAKLRVTLEVLSAVIGLCGSTVSSRQDVRHLSNGAPRVRPRGALLPLPARPGRAAAATGVRQTQGKSACAAPPLRLPSSPASLPLPEPPPRDSPHHPLSPLSRASLALPWPAPPFPPGLCPARPWVCCPGFAKTTPRQPAVREAVLAVLPPRCWCRGMCVHAVAGITLFS